MWVVLATESRLNIPNPIYAELHHVGMTQRFDVNVPDCLTPGKGNPKKVSGRWGFRPLGRGDGGKRNPKLFLTSRRYAALASSITAHRSSLNCSGSRDQLPITVAIVISPRVSVDSSAGPSHPVLSASCFRTVPQVPWYCRPANSRTAIARSAVCQACPIDVYELCLQLGSSPRCFSDEFTGLRESA